MSSEGIGERNVAKIADNRLEITDQRLKSGGRAVDHLGFLAECVEVWGNVVKCEKRKRKKFRNRLFLDSEKHSLRTERLCSSINLSVLKNMPILP